MLRVTQGSKENEAKAALYAATKAEEWYRKAGAIEVQRTTTGGNGPGLSTHAFGGTRMGNNPDTSVVDKWGFSHEAPNLGVLGGSVIVSSGARNPTGSIQALAWRTADYLAKNWKKVVA